MPIIYTLEQLLREAHPVLFQTDESHINATSQFTTNLPF